ncbi:alpha-2-macroglobulin-like protein 1, partial [Discoglossus pictus]
MWSQLLLLIVATSTLAQNPLPYYIVLVPAEVHYPSTEVICVHVSEVRERLRLTLTLQTAGQDTIILQQDMEDPNLFRCIPFQVLPPSHDQEEVVAIHISLVGPFTQISESKNILIRDMGSNIFIQTDKPIYKKGQTVKFRILKFNPDFMAVNDKVSLVELQDPNSNRIGQWLDLSPQQGIVNLSFPLDSEAPLGTYTIRTPNGQQLFHVAEYVLPPYEVNILLPTVVTLVQETFPLKICGKYTFGKSVQGVVTAQLCRRVVEFFWSPREERPQDLCRNYTGRTDRSGCLNLEISTSFYQMRSYDYQPRFEAEASLLEDKTGLQLNGSNSCRISAMLAKVTFEDTEVSDSYYKPGLRYKAMLKLESAEGSPMKSKKVFLKERYNKVTTEHVYETDEAGLVCFTLDTKKWGGHEVTLTASYYKGRQPYEYGELNPYFQDSFRVLQQFTTITNSFLKVQPMDNTLLCNQEYKIDIDYIIRGSEIISGKDTLDLYYMVIAKGNVVLDGKLKIDVNRNSVVMGMVELPLLVTANMAPLAHILVYTILGNGRIAADTEKYPINKCFNNKVSLSFSKHETAPGSEISLQASASPGSLCAIKVVDESVLLVRPEAELSGDSLYSLISQRSRYGYHHRVQEYDNPCWKPHPRYSKRSLAALHRKKRYVPGPASNTPDVFTLIQEVGLKILTNTLVKKPKECLYYPPMAAMLGFESGFTDYNVHHDNPSVVRVEDSYELSVHLSPTYSEIKNKIRKDFLETWIWEMLPVGTSGQVVLNSTLPDTITDWKGTMFCMGNNGLGISPTATIRTFQALFVDSRPPYSVVRGESFPLSASVYNYQSMDLMVQINLKEMPGMQVIKCPLCNYTQCVPAEEIRVFTWNVRALQPGTMHIELSVKAVDDAQCGGDIPEWLKEDSSDTIIKTLLVKPEGMPVEKFQNFLLCAQGNLSSETFSLSLPPGAVPGSGIAGISVVGDMLGAALEGIDVLLELPRACGEQNMLRLAPNIYVMDYLEKTNQMTEAIKTRGLDYMMTGYQRQLLFRREDNSYSAFGEKDDDGNTWLTAFVLRSLCAASRLMYVDEKYLEGAVIWLKENQLPSGCFRCRGKLFKTSLKGGVEDEVALSAYVSTSLIVAGLSLEDDVLQSALQCLRSAVWQVDSLYTKSILAYAFTLFKDFEIRDAILKELYDKAEKRDGLVYWPSIYRRTSEDSMMSQPHSVDVELASYVALAYLSAENPSNEDINSASPVISWIALQRNPHGGFASTQDTVVGLQALTRFCALTYTAYGGLEVTVHPVDGEGPHHRLWVDRSTRLLLQRIRLDSLPGTYTAQVNGDGCVYLQMTLKYNTYTAKTSPAFDLQLNTSRVGCEHQSASSFNLTISARYIGPLRVTNMAIIEVNLLSGHSVIPEALQELESHSLVKRIETKLDKVVVYLQELSNQTHHFSILLRQDILMENQESQLVKVYDYYDPDKQAKAMYNKPPGE